MRLLLLALLIAASPVPLLSEVLVLKDGERVETQGAWTVKDRVVIFTDVRGVLSSVRLDLGRGARRNDR